MKNTESVIEVLEGIVSSRKTKLSKIQKETLKEVIKHIKIADDEPDPKKRRSKLLDLLGTILKVLGVSALRSLINDGEP